MATVASNSRFRALSDRVYPRSDAGIAHGGRFRYPPRASLGSCIVRRVYE
ncbi:hypothetical protein PS896_03734 [Pseudomonas fluorescens]|jgi:hypothetical protein|uniref:Uncharacterized protein n=1 Tax=Pseudomonas fluorescens TaxID=294 RepID=A0A5E7M4M4_PSEFL|nr:hypothetical protein PS896_03734 [Pseudomonas fluorescens]